MVENDKTLVTPSPSMNTKDKMENYYIKLIKDDIVSDAIKKEIDKDFINFLLKFDNTKTVKNFSINDKIKQDVEKLLKYISEKSLPNTPSGGITKKIKKNIKRKTKIKRKIKRKTRRNK